MQKILKILFSAVVALALTGCNLISLDDFMLLGGRMVSLDGMSKAVVELTIENRSPFKVKVTDGELDIFYRGSELGTLTLDGEVVLPRRSVTTVEVAIDISFMSPLAALRAVKAVVDHPDEMTVSGYGEGRIWIFRKRMERKNVPVSKFIDIFGSPSNYL